MKINLFFIISFLLKILFINSDCNYITIGANKNKCAVIDKDDKTKTCCFVKIKKNSYSMSFCYEIKHTKAAMNEYKKKFKEQHDVSSIDVECKCNYLKNKIFYLGFIFIIIIL